MTNDEPDVDEEEKPMLEDLREHLREQVGSDDIDSDALDDLEDTGDVAEALGISEYRVEFSVNKSDDYHEFLTTKVRHNSQPLSNDVIRFEFLHEYEPVPEREAQIVDPASDERSSEREVDSDYIRDFRGAIVIPLDAARSMTEFMLAKVLDSEYDKDISESDIHEMTEEFIGGSRND